MLNFYLKINVDEHRKLEISIDSQHAKDEALNSVINKVLKVMKP